MAGHAVTATRGPAARSSGDGRATRRMAVGAARRSPAICVLMSGGWTPRCICSRSRAASCAATRPSRPSCPAIGERRALGRRLQRHVRPRRRPARRLAPGEAAAAAAGWLRTSRSRASLCRRRAGAKAACRDAAQPRSATAQAFVDFQNDVTAKDLALAVREGFRSIEHVKRYTTTGMATDQGKTSNMNAPRDRGAGDWTCRSPTVGLTTFRPPYTPSPSAPSPGQPRATCSTRSAARRCMTGRQSTARSSRMSGMWKRAWYFPRGRRGHARRRRRECRAVRNAVGLFDASTLGKIEVVGPDAAEFLEPHLHQPLATARAGPLPLWRHAARGRLHLSTTASSAASPTDRFHVTTTTGGAAARAAHDGGLPPDRIARSEGLAHLDHRAMGGHRGAGTEGARGASHRWCEGIDLSPDALPHMACARACICGVPTRLFRVSFTGELGFEINVPADHGRGRLGGDLASAASPSASRPTAPRRCTCCAPKRASSSSARRPTAR